MSLCPIAAGNSRVEATLADTTVAAGVNVVSNCKDLKVGKVVG
jgi:hypothetical protein